MSKIPKHVAIIMDGNGRWAEKRGLSRELGHVAGAKRVREIVAAAQESGLEVLTIWGFSTDNHKRPENEVQALMGLFKKYIQEESTSLIDQNIKVTFIGNSAGLPPVLVDQMKKLAGATSSNIGMHLQVALNYGGEDELDRALQKLQQAGGPFTAAGLRDELDTVGVCNPDFVIRTSGEMRTSGFMPLQMMSAELYFYENDWPDFTVNEFQGALKVYAGRQRRFGGLTPPRNATAT